MAGLFPRWKPLSAKASASGGSRPAWAAFSYGDGIPELIEKGQYVQAEAKLREEVQAADRGTLTTARRIRLRIELALVERFQASDPGSPHLDGAEKTLREAIAIAAKEKDVPAYLECLDQLAEIFELRGEWAAVEASLREAVRLQAARPAADLIGAATRLRRLAMARHRIKDFAGALEASQDAVRLAEQSYGPDHLEMGNLLNETGRLLRAQGNFAEAEEYLRRAIRIHRKLLGDASSQVISDLQQLAGSLQEAGNLQGAAKEYELCLHVKQRQLGVQHIDELGLMQYSLANIYISWGDLARARELLIEAVGAFRPAGGARLAVAHETLAQVEEASGRHQLALRELELAAKSWERCGPERTAELVRNLEYRADLLVEMRKHREASWLREKADERRTVIAESELDSDHAEAAR